MKNPWFIKIHFPQSKAFDIVKVSRPYFIVPWHFHPEIEIMLLTSGSGTRFVGDSIEAFQANELVMVGANLAHVWKSGEGHFGQKNTQLAGAMYIVVKETELDHILLYEEMRPVRELFLRAQRGIQFGYEITKRVGEMILEAYQQSGPDQLVSFLNVLKELAETSDYRYLCSAHYRQKVDHHDMAKLDSVLDYLIMNYKNEVRLEEVADIANMSLTAFCRYFKERAHKTVIQFLNEIRIEQAQKMLLETQYNVDKISLECGFKNITNFYQQFQKIVGTTPLNFRKQNLVRLY
ncbi:AraC family transcriptional regulator [Dyadobacter pollutisoli]|uniref:AraC family transcriptional regulator n=1 Tax=Dyadobacter pollutisoli TaxID=2910158 RepID=A0A9E8SN92_9BACT|nr:AraC family transcriptional regulator [Dyadobacter pollutisoli]WAC15018.1 AraC family transcriptional regulator [Dyadobacter pollutisoli]